MENDCSDMVDMQIEQMDKFFFLKEDKVKK